MRRHVLALFTLLLLVVPTGTAPAQEGEPAFDRISDNISLVDHLQFPQGTDMYFQRREGRQLRSGTVVDGTYDYLFAGADASAAVGEPPDGGFLGVKIYDVTDPTAPVELAAPACGGYHADMQVYENYLIQAVDSADSNTGCPDSLDPDGVDADGVAGIRIYDVTDPADPTVVAFVDAEALENSVHNITTLPWAGLLYIAGSSFGSDDPGNFTIVDLDDPAFGVTVLPMEEISPTARAECHDIGVAQLEEQDLAFCAAVHETFVWDITDPLAPVHLSAVPLAVESIHHAARLAPDGTTLVLNDELGGAAVAPGCVSTTADPLGALWFYDISDPTSPQLQGTFSTDDLAAESPCTSHFYNFIPGTTLLTVGWYKSGMIVVDYGDLPATSEHAYFAPTGGDFWASYYWHGYVYGNSFGGGGLYGGTDEAGGVWIAQLDGVGDREPSPHDEGTSWSRWTSQLPNAHPENTVTNVDADGTLVDLPCLTDGRLAGTDRIATALQVACSGWDQADVAILARSDDFADALASSALAAEVDGPLLLTPTGELHDDVAAALTDLGVSKVYLAGGEAALSADVASQADAAGLEVERLFGPTRYDTAAAIADEVVELGGTVDDVVIARGDLFADALGAANVATWDRAPILLTPSSHLSRAATDALGRIVADDVNVYVAGGEAALSAQVDRDLEAAGFVPQRMDGADRYATQIGFVDAAMALGATAQRTWLASGTDFPDALTAGVGAWKDGAMVLQVHPRDLDASGATRDKLAAEDVDQIVIVGGTAAVSEDVEVQANDTSS